MDSRRGRKNASSVEPETRKVQPVDTRNLALTIRVEKRWQDARRIEKR